MVSMHGFGTVWREDTAILPHTSSDGQTGLVPHGFRKRQLERTEEEKRGEQRNSREEFGI